MGSTRPSTPRSRPSPASGRLSSGSTPATRRGCCIWLDAGFHRSDSGFRITVASESERVELLMDWRRTPREEGWSYRSTVRVDGVRVAQSRTPDAQDTPIRSGRRTRFACDAPR